MQPLNIFAATATVGLGTADSFAVLAGTAVNDANISEVSGNVGLSPDGWGASTPVITCAEVTGTIYSVDGSGPALCRITNPGLLTTAKNDLTTAYGDAAGRTPVTTLAGGDNQLGSKTLTAGVYTFSEATSANLSGTLTLDAEGDANAVFIFKAPSTLITASSSTVSLINGAQACNVFWQVTSSATLGTSSTFVGTIMADASITDNGGSTVQGRFLARTAAVTLNNTTITKPTCTTTTTSSTSSSTNTAYNVKPCVDDLITTVPIIINSSRVSPTSVSLNWGPYTGTDTFVVRYGFENGNWLYSTNVTGFSTTLNDLPANQPIWVQVAEKNNCSIGTYSEARLIGGPGLPNTGFGPHEYTIQ